MGGAGAVLGRPRKDARRQPDSRPGRCRDGRAGARAGRAAQVRSRRGRRCSTRPRSRPTPSLHASAKYEQVGVDVGNGWQRQENGGLWGSDWFGRAQAAVVYILVNDYHEAVYLIRGTDAKGALLDGKHSYTMTFPKDALPPVDRSRGGFWSLTMYDRDYFMLPEPPNGRTNIGTVSLDAERAEVRRGRLADPHHVA